MADVTASAVRSLGMSRGEDDCFRMKIVTVTLPASYATSGDKILGTGFETIFGLIPMGNTGGYMLCWLPATQRLKAYWVDTTTDGAPMAEATAATNLSGISLDFLALGV